MPTANTRACFEELIGHHIVGVLFDALPLSDRSIFAGTKTLILDDGRGLTISARGTYWFESAKDVRRAIECQRDELQRTQARLKGVLALAGGGAPDE